MKVHLIYLEDVRMSNEHQYRVYVVEMVPLVALSEKYFYSYKNCVYTKLIF